jgi:hypothetical protein
MSSQVTHHSEILPSAMRKTAPKSNCVLAPDAGGRPIGPRCVLHMSPISPRNHHRRPCKRSFALNRERPLHPAAEIPSADPSCGFRLRVSPGNGVRHRLQLTHRTLRVDGCAGQGDAGQGRGDDAGRLRSNLLLRQQAQLAHVAVASLPTPRSRSPVPVQRRSGRATNSASRWHHGRPATSCSTRPPPCCSRRS